MNAELEEFAKILVANVRDASIQSSDRTLNEDHIIAKRWKKAAALGSPEEFAKVLIPDIVDSTISHLLGAIDQELLRLSFTSSNGNSVDLTSVAEKSGDLSGWYKGEGGWCQKYSKTRVVDDFANLKGFFQKPSEQQ